MMLDFYLQYPNENEDAQSKFSEKRELFFAGLDEHRVQFTTGRDIRLPGSSTPPLNYVIYPHVEVEGEPYENVETNFFFREIGGA